MACVELEDASVTFCVRRKKSSIKDWFVRPGRRQQDNPIHEIHALRHIKVSLRDGARLAVIGHNGAGKSTFLRVIAGVYHPTSGLCRVTGRISTMLDLIAGIEMEATGWENIRLRGHLLGLSPHDVAAKIEAIGAFSELGDFLSLPVRCYSAGMIVRLTLSILTAVSPEILIIDECFSAGDLAFQLKSSTRIRQMADHANILIMAGHDLKTLVELCDQALWLDHGSVRQLGPVVDVVRAYQAAQLTTPAAA